jgi:hypothetical protein
VSDIFEEIKDDLHYEKALGFWKSYQNYIVNGGAAILIGVCAYAGWQHYEDGKNVERAKAYYVGAFEADTNRTKDALEQLKTVAASGNSAYGDLARLKAAGILTDKKDIPGAIALYKSVQDSHWGGATYENFAIINAGYLDLDTATDDSFLKPLDPLCREGNPWRGSALELKGLYYIKQKKWSAALEAFDTILKDKSIMQNLKIRASKLHVYALEQEQQP